MNSPPLSVCSSRSATGSRREAASSPPPTRSIPIPQTGCTSVQPGRYVHHGQRRQEETLQALSAVQDKVCLGRPRPHPRPLAPGPDRYLLLQARCSRSRPPGLPAQTLAPVRQLTVDRRRAHRDQRFAHTRRQAQFTVSLKAFHKGRQHCCQQLAAHPVARLPYLHQSLCHLRPVTRRPALLRHCGQPTPPSQKPDRRLPVQPSGLAELVEDPVLLFLPRPPVPPSHRGRVLVQSQPRHVAPFR